jgi:hypothetical protein
MFFSVGIEVRSCRSASIGSITELVNVESMMSRFQSCNLSSDMNRTRSLLLNNKQVMSFKDRKIRMNRIQRYMEITHKNLENSLKDVPILIPPVESGWFPELILEERRLLSKP